jgi:hypothetical protein
MGVIDEAAAGCQIDKLSNAGVGNFCDKCRQQIVANCLKIQGWRVHRRLQHHSPPSDFSCEVQRPPSRRDCIDGRLGRVRLKYSILWCLLFCGRLIVLERARRFRDPHFKRGESVMKL